MSKVKLIPICFFLFDALLNVTFCFLFLILMYRKAADFYMLILSHNFTEFIYSNSFQVETLGFPI